MQGYVVPDSFTDGTSEQRKRWFLNGLIRAGLGLRYAVGEHITRSAPARSAGTHPQADDVYEELTKAMSTINAEAEDRHGVAACAEV